MRYIMIFMLLAALSGCSVMTSTGGAPATTPAEALAKVQAGAAYLDGALTKVKAAVATAKVQAPAALTAIEDTLEPAVATLQTLVVQYDAAVAAENPGAAESRWPVTRAAVTAVLRTAASVLGPQLLGLLGV